MQFRFLFTLRELFTLSRPRIGRGWLRGGYLSVGCCLLLGGCQNSATPTAAAAPASNSTLQQVQSDPAVPDSKKQQIADSLARSQQAANDPRLLRNRPTPAR